MSWQVRSTSDPGRWCGWEDAAPDEGDELAPVPEGTLTGDEATLDHIAELIDGEDEVALTPQGPFRDVTSMNDQVGVYLFATQVVIPPPYELIGNLPTEETEELPEGAVA